MTTPTRASRARRATASEAAAADAVGTAPDVRSAPALAPDAPPPTAADRPDRDGDGGSRRRRRPARDPDGGTGEVHELLTAAVDEAARLLAADGAMVYLIDPATGHLRFAHDAGILSKRSRAWVRSIDLPVGTGMFGRAVADRAIVLTRDYLADESFIHAPDPDRVVRDIGIRSMVVAPLVAGEEVFGAIGTFSSRFDAFSPAQIGLVRALADHAAAAMSNARLIEALDASRGELAKRAEIERSLREIGAKISAASDLPAVLQLSVDEAARLLDAHGARIDLIDRETGLLHGAYASGALQPRLPLPPDPNETLDQGVAGQAVVHGRPFWTGDYVNDGRFPHLPGIDDYIISSGIRSVMAAPLTDETGAFGALLVSSDRPDAWDETDAGLLATIADQASITIRTTRLIAELDASREVLARRAEAEQALRENAARITVLRQPGAILQDVVEQAGRLVRADGVILDLLDTTTGNLHWALDDGLSADFTEAERDGLWISVGVGATGTAVAEDRVVVAGDDLASLFPPSVGSTAFYERTGFHSMIAAPITGDAGPLGVIEVYSKQRAAFNDIDAGLVGALASQAAIAITNARLIEELGRSQAAVAKRADTERALRDITARIAALREPEVILERVVEEARRLLGSDGAHLTRMSDDGTNLVPVVVTGATEAEAQSWLLGLRFPLDGGINGLAASHGVPVWTSDYATDPRIPHDPDDVAVAERMGLCGMAAAPLRAPGGEVIGTLAISSARPRSFDPEELDLLQGLADQAAIAITNSTLLTRLTESEERYRYLVENAPDIVFSTDADGRVTFMSDAVERMTGFRAEELLGQHFGAFVHESSAEVAEMDWSAGLGAGAQEIRGRVNLVARDGSAIPTEFIAIARLDESRRFIGANGSVRDMRERDRLERDLQESEARFRNLVQTTPDVIYRCDADGRFLFMAEGAEALFGWTPAEVSTLTFADLTAAESLAEALANFTDQHEERDVVRRFRYMLRRRDGSTFPGDISSVAVWEDGRFAGVQGTVRDISEQERLEHELRASQDRYRFLVENSPDVVFSTDAEGRFTFMSEAMERMSGWPPEEVTGGHFSRVVDEASHPEAMARWLALMTSPEVEQVAHIKLRSPDGSRLVPVEVSAIGMVDAEGRFAGIHGSTRDISERYRLEHELRESEERYRYLVAASPDLVWVTDAVGTFTFISDAASAMIGRDPSELIGRPFQEAFAPEAVRDASVRFRWVARHPSAVHRMRLPFRHADGHDIMVEISGTGMIDEGGRFAGAHGSARDVSERDRLERDLRRQAGELAAGEERAHLARELHDSVTQALFSMTLVSRSVEMLLDRDREAAKGQLSLLRELQREALAEMRALIFELRPGNLEQDGLTRALRTHSAALQGRIGLPVVVESTLEERLPLPIEEVMYRISQEALHNVVKHANARQVRVELGRIASGIRLRITDDGKGFDPDRVPDGHLGLAGMRARAAKIGGRFMCRSVPGEGTTIEVVVPDAAIVAGGAAPAPAGPASIRDG